MPIAEAVGAIAAHTLKVGELVLKKGTSVSGHHVRLLAEAGITEIVAARLGPEDVQEDEAAERIAIVAAGALVRIEPPFTGRANLFAERAGLLLVDIRAVDDVNTIDEAVTLATLPAFKPVVAGEMIGTVKIIPYAAPRGAVEAAVSAARNALAIAPYS
jgi:molybdenum cofactor cytidylyltransferase